MTVGEISSECSVVPEALSEPRLFQSRAFAALGLVEVPWVESAVPVSRSIWHANIESVRAVIIIVQMFRFQSGCWCRCVSE